MCDTCDKQNLNHAVVSWICFYCKCASSFAKLCFRSSVVMAPILAMDLTGSSETHGVQIGEKKGTSGWQWGGILVA